MLLGAPTSKPTIVYSNGSFIQGLNMGPLKKATREKKTMLKPVRKGPSTNSVSHSVCHLYIIRTQICVFRGKYHNKDGVKKFVGTSDLKKTASSHHVWEHVERFSSIQHWSPVVPLIFPDPSLARCYPDGFVRRLMTLWEGRSQLPVCHLRHRPNVDMRSTDRELFAKTPLGDPWLESGIHHVFKYLWNCKHVKIPDTWLHTMKEFNEELTQVVPRLIDYSHQIQILMVETMVKVARFRIHI